MKTRKTGLTGKLKSDDEWIYGLNPVFEALRAGRKIKAVYLSSSRQEKTEELKQEGARLGIPVKAVDSFFFDAQFGRGHQGVAAEVQKKGYVLLDDLLEIPAGKEELPFFFILDCLEDPRNLGAVLRVADAAGVHGIVVQAYRSVRLGAEVSKVSAGSVEYVPVALVPNIKHAIRHMKNKGILIIGAESAAEKTIWEQDLSGPVALVIGSEGKGLRRTVREHCDGLAGIPMKGMINSLNVSVAAGICAFEILRQRLEKYKKN
ncbi:MAG: 23S rRNA (guanosine(2251)-2'-O)-methyltransferase RlmB [Nitrospirota bacterium]